VKGVARIAWLLLAVLLPAAAICQQGKSVAQAKSLFIENFSGGADAALLHDGVSRALAKSHQFRLASSAADADAIMKGTGAIWVRGHISTNTRTPANNRQAVYSGYLSVQVVDAAGQPLWSWLATPGRLAWQNVVDDLANQTVRKLLDAGQFTPSSSSGSAPINALTQAELTGAGATFPAPLYLKWFEDFEQLHQGVRIHYTGTGSQLGVNKLLAGDLDFAGSDIAPEAMGQTGSASHLRRIASVLGAVVAIYNLNGAVQDLHFTPEALAGIYLGRIHRWDDPELRRSNRGVALPDAEIAVIHRSDGSGTTWIWSDYLSKVSPAWASNAGHGATLKWPVGVGAAGSEGVAEAVEKTPNSIGYVELAYAVQHQLSFAGVRNRAGEYIHANLDSLTEAAVSSSANGEPAADITDAPGKDAYPIAAFTWLLLPSEMADPAKKAALTELLQWILTSGQKECASLGYAPLSREAVESQLRLLDTLR
jgi:phosphate transport system substrate-binding protein